MANNTLCQWDKAGKYNKACVDPQTHVAGVRKLRMCAKHAYQCSRDFGWKVRALAGMKA